MAEIVTGEIFMKILLLFLFCCVLFLHASEVQEILCQDGKFAANNGFFQRGKKTLLFDPAIKSYFWFQPAEKDWSRYKVITFRIWSPAKIRGELLLCLNSNPAGSRNNYYSKRITIFHSGWKTFSYRLDSFTKTRTPVGFHQIDNVTFMSKGWGLKQREGFKIEFDSVTLSIEEAVLSKKELPPLSATICWPPDIPDDLKAKTLREPDFLRKSKEIESMRLRFKRKILSKFSNTQKKLSSEYLGKISPEGSFLDISAFNVKEEWKCNLAYERLKFLLQAWNGGLIPHTPEIKQKLLDAFIYYFDFEYNRTSERWVASSFNFPEIAIEAYFTFLPEMEEVERSLSGDQKIILLNRLCKAVAMQAFYEPERNDVEHCLQLDQFRAHPHWVGGNFGYRPLVACALVCRNPLMLDLVAEIFDKGLSVTSWNTRSRSFWQEGLTTDGGGWGHGVQCYLFGYPLDGVISILKGKNTLNNTLWERRLDPYQQDLILGYIESLLWFSYAPEQYGPTLMSPARAGMLYRGGKGFQSFPQFIFKLIESNLPENAVESKKRLKNYENIASGKIPEFTGIRYWWNQDAMISRGRDYFIGIKMSSVRTASCEVVAGASRKTEFLSDGATFLMKRPDTYTMAKGYWNFTAVPGTTLRQGEYQVNTDIWSGYRGMYSFAGGVTDSGNGVAGFHYRKALSHIREPLFYNIEARKSYFVAGGFLICCGSGITDLDPKQGKHLWTTIDQTEWLGNLEYEKAGKMHRVKTPDFIVHKQKIGTMMAVHDSVGYGIDLNWTKGEAILSTEVRKSRWLEADRRNAGNSGIPVEYPVLQIHVDHGKNVKNASYLYFVHMDSPNLENLKRNVAEMDYEILALTDSVHAVRIKKTDMTGAVFFDKNSTFSDGVRTWKCDEKAIVLICREPGGKVRISVTDPEQNPEKKTIGLFCNPALNGQKEFRFSLPVEDNCGKSVSAVSLPCS